MLHKTVRIIAISLSLPLFVLMGCTSSQPFIPVAQYTSDTALFVYSPLQVRNGHEIPVVHINGEEVTRLTNGALAVVNLKPGLHEITLYKMETPFTVKSQAFYAATFTIEQGERLYFRWQEDKTYDVSLTADSFAGPMDYRFVPAQIASTELSEAKIKTVTVLPVRAPLES
ncbi:DUF2846 domain-containing protein [Alteromonas flava]|uniref:DUF2846 domain-containing protein n=1 Tax=Alteromonas flava TaxID=2048003 RepID=UPI000C284D35|nr:DUF2846 domain-containing protein [Alteromonas flava]